MQGTAVLLHPHFFSESAQCHCCQLKPMWQAEGGSSLHLKIWVERKEKVQSNLLFLFYSLGRNLEELHSGELCKYHQTSSKHRPWKQDRTGLRGGQTQRSIKYLLSREARCTQGKLLFGYLLHFLDGLETSFSWLQSLVGRTEPLTKSPPESDWGQIQTQNRSTPAVCWLWTETTSCWQYKKYSKDVYCLVQLGFFPLLWVTAVDKSLEKQSVSFTFPET